MRIKKFAQTIILCTGITLLLSGCLQVRDSYSSDGRKAYAVSCNGITGSWDQCQAAAGNICGTAGYDILDRSTDRNMQARLTGGGASASYNETRSNTRSMLIACKSAPSSSATMLH